MNYTPPKEFKPYPVVQPKARIDEWGVVWTEGRVIDHPLSKWDALSEYVFPDIEAEGRFDLAKTSIEENKKNEFVAGRVWFTFFERLWFLRGFNNCIIDVLRKDKRLSDLANRLMDFNTKAIKMTLETGVDAIFLSDDYGTQKGPIFPLKVWTEFFLPRWKEMFSAVHKGGAITMLHSCGDVMPIIPHLIEAGLDVLNPIQPQAMDIETLGKRYCGKICFLAALMFKELCRWEAKRMSKEK